VPCGLARISRFTVSGGGGGAGAGAGAGGGEGTGVGAGRAQASVNSRVSITTVSSKFLFVIFPPYSVNFSVAFVLLTISLLFTSSQSFTNFLNMPDVIPHHKPVVNIKQATVLSASRLKLEVGGYIIDGDKPSDWLGYFRSSLLTIAGFA
jgi:hypothetical protein